jgi:hypothetical protein
MSYQTYMIIDHIIQMYQNQGRIRYNAYNGYKKNEVENLIGYSQAGYRRVTDLKSEKQPVKLFNYNLRNLIFLQKSDFLLA